MCPRRTPCPFPCLSGRPDMTRPALFSVLCLDGAASGACSGGSRLLRSSWKPVIVAERVLVGGGHVRTGPSLCGVRPAGVCNFVLYLPCWLQLRLVGWLHCTALYTCAAGRSWLAGRGCGQHGEPVVFLLHLHACVPWLVRAARPLGLAGRASTVGAWTHASFHIVSLKHISQN